MKVLSGFLIAIFTCGLVFAQPSLDLLSSKHIQKIENESSARDKLKSYKKFYSKASIKHVKHLEKYWQSKSDSLLASIQERENQLSGKAEKLSERSTKKFNNTFARFNPSVKDTTNHKLLLDSLLSGNAGKLKSKVNVSLRGKPDPTTSIKEKFNDTGVSKLRGKLNNVTSGLNAPKKELDTTNLEAIPDSLGNMNMNLPIDHAAVIKEKANKVGNEILQNSNVAEVKALTNEVKGYQGDFKKYQGQLESYTQNDSLAKQDIKNRVVAEVRSRAGTYKELQALEAYKKKVEALDPMQNEYKQQLDQLQDSTYRKEQARKKAEEMAMDYIAENPALMKAAKSKMDLLMKKYSIVPNSNDLSTAVKRNSLKGKSFKERLYLAGNFQVLSLKPVSFDFSPLVGYRFSSGLIAGVGGNFRKTFSDTLTKAASEVFGYKAFASYDILMNFFAYSEFANNTTGYNQTEGSPEHIWSSSFLLGAGRKFTIHPKVEMTMVVLYNFTRKPGDTIYPSPWVVRFGFQLSELALLKRKPELGFR